MCEAKMDPESPEDSDKQNMIDIKPSARTANSESPSPPTGPAPAASPSQTTTTTPTSTSAVRGTTPPIKHCPLTPQSQVTAGDDDDEDDVHERDADESDQVEDEDDGGHRNHYRHHTPNRNRHHHHARYRNHHHHHNDQEQPYNYGINKMKHDDDNLTSEDDEISVGRSPSPSPTLVISPSSDHQFQHDLTNSSIHNKRNNRHLMQNPEEEYFKPLKKLRMLKVESPTSQNAVGVKSFSISDILSHKPSQKKTHNTKSSSNSSGSSNCSSRTIDIENVVINTHHHQQQQQRIVRPWDPHQQSNKSNGRRNSSDSSPLDALFQMTSKTFEGLNGHHEGSEFGGQGNAHQAFNARQPPKKKRKSRTAFTNHQIFELEKRFLYQKYLSPADRDDIAHQLGLTNAQVITWFQNRRAKLKRDMEEMKKDAESLHMLSAHKTFLESAHDLALLKKRAQSMDMSSAAAAAAFHISSPTSSSQSSHSPINLTSESPPSTH